MHAIAYPPLSLEKLRDAWAELLKDQDTPPYAELNEFGEILVGPPLHPKHERIVFALAEQMKAQLGGEAGSAPILTKRGIRKPDVAWMGDPGEWERLCENDAFPVAPTICVEVISPGNNRRDLNDKLEAYLAAGAREVIFVELDGRIRFFDSTGERDESSFGLRLTLPRGTYPR